MMLASDATTCFDYSNPQPYTYLINWCANFCSLETQETGWDTTRLFPMTYGTMLFVLAILKAIEFWKLNGFHGSRLVFILVRDQAMYFMLYVEFPIRVLITHADVSCRAIFVSVFSIVGDELYSNNTVIESIVLALGSPTLLSILGSRMFFNLKEAAEHGVNVGTNWSSYSHSAIHFDAPHCTENPWATHFNCSLSAFFIHMSLQIGYSCRNGLFASEWHQRTGRRSVRFVISVIVFVLNYTRSSNTESVA